MVCSVLPAAQPYYHPRYHYMASREAMSSDPFTLFCGRGVASQTRLGQTMASDASCVPAKLTLPAPAKLNLFLHITGRREDGYHNLQTLFQFLDLADEISLSSLAGEDLEVSPELPGVHHEENLVYRAGRLLQKYTGCRLGARIHLKKTLPLGGGVGGGSSDAATTLIGLNHLWQTGLDEDQLALLGRQLGADVPVFVRGRAAFAEGVGEQLYPMDIPEQWYLLVVPECQVKTAEVFHHPNLPRNTPKIAPEDALKVIGENDFEEIVRKLYPPVDRAMIEVNKVGRAHLTGSGSCVFATYNTREEAESAKLLLPKEWLVYVARGCNESPLHRQLQL